MVKANFRTKNKFMALYDSISQYCPDTGINTEAYILFYQGGPISHGTHFPGPVAQ